MVNEKERMKMSMSKSNAQFVVKKIYENGVTTYLTKENCILNFT